MNKCKHCGRKILNLDNFYEKTGFCNDCIIGIINDSLEHEKSRLSGV